MKGRSSICLLLGICFGLLGLAGCARNHVSSRTSELLDDKVIELRAKTALADAGPDYRDLRVLVKDGTVVLQGTVPSPEARVRAEGIVRDATPTAANLRDDVRVVEPSGKHQ